MILITELFVLSLLWLVESRTIHFHENMRMVKRFPCAPRPRSISVSKFLDDSIEYRSITPPWVILHKCDETAGCCRNMRDTCTMRTKEHVKVEVWLEARHDIMLHPHHIHVTNHTSCSCEQMDNSIK